MDDGPFRPVLLWIASSRVRFFLGPATSGSCVPSALGASGARICERWTLETFPVARQPGVNRKQIHGFAELEFIAKAEKIVFQGKQDRISL
jgi:hypothetical protein